jgi:oxygen-independent coproporphyrinogen III oxidase
MNPSSLIDGHLLQRYDRPGPRYTSYPTVPQFRNDFSAEDFYARALPAGVAHVPGSV